MPRLSKQQLKRKLQQLAIVDPVTGCWHWPGKQRENGYCRTTWCRKNWYVHRLSYFVFKGDIPEGYDICHHCDNRRCFNPEHLFAGTRKANMQDAVKKGRQAKGSKLSILRQGEKSNFAKLRMVDVLKIRKMGNTGENARKIASLFEVTPDNIKRILKRDTWTHI